LLKQLPRRFEHAAPFGLLEMAAAGAKLLPPLLETRHHLLKVVLVRVGQSDISGHERRPHRTTGNADKCRLKPSGQGDGELYPLFRIDIDVDVHHQCRKRYEILLFPLIRADCSSRIRGKHRCFSPHAIEMLSATTSNRPDWTPKARA
jgi:hypothetical protein